ncbi:hypothetical protein [Thiocystis violascens]|uniref:Uncharacterized protein n=1 Tax=Thiocystis violascens (strain ATCC 17096 / DSM 198 / 6111) TaxID=765911 RepID=I3Y798_THIV6|nr:hypothetical protein [Thiocystis violascens]AFL72866.1 hypothetical protein Thivi_0824 [Thiocystis violascens DSM 198]
MPIDFDQDKLQDRPIDDDLLGQRPIGLAKGMFEVPASFFEPLPDDLLDAVRGVSPFWAIVERKMKQ